ncbi:MAG: hypothetical protein JRI96_10055 [Deltaproteobacteria bacterium]|nr:hypothetical protein [Deltaproteobacteria bacterium]
MATLEHAPPFEDTIPDEFKVIVLPSITDNHDSVGGWQFAANTVEFTYSLLRQPQSDEQIPIMRLFRFGQFYHEAIPHLGKGLPEEAALSHNLRYLLRNRDINRDILKATVEVLSTEMCGMQAEEWLGILHIAQARIKSQQDITSVVWSLAEQLHRLGKN